MAGNYEPIPRDLQQRIRILEHDITTARANLGAGRLRPEHFGDLQRVLGQRLEVLEAEVHTRLLEEARRRNGRFKLN